MKFLEFNNLNFDIQQPNLPLQMRENILRMIQQCEQQIQVCSVYFSVLFPFTYLYGFYIMYNNTTRFI